MSTESCKHRDVVPMKIVTSNDERIDGWCCCECGTEFAPVTEGMRVWRRFAVECARFLNVEQLAEAGQRSGWSTHVCNLSPLTQKTDNPTPHPPTDPEGA